MVMLWMAMVVAVAVMMTVVWVEMVCQGAPVVVLVERVPASQRLWAAAAVERGGSAARPVRQARSTRMRWDLPARGS